MHKPTLHMIVALTVLATTITWAQSFFSSTPAPTTPPPATKNSPALSADEIKKLTLEQNQQTQDAINNKMKEFVAKLPPAQAPTLPPETNPSTAGASAEFTMPPNPPETAAAPVAPAPSLPQPSTTGTSSTQVTPPTPTQNQPYTGFIGGNTNTTTPDNSTKSNTNTGGGWNIKY